MNLTWYWISYTDQERYILTNDQNNNPIPEEVVFTATLRQGGELSETGDHTKTVGEPVTDAIIGIQVAAPDGQIVVGPLVHMGDGIYTLTLETTLAGNYDVDVIASDNVSNGNVRNSQYFITTEHSFYVSPYEEPTEFNGKAYIQKALDELLAIKAEFCPSNNNCSWSNKTKKDINNAISYLNTALGYFETNDGNHLKTNKGLSFYDKVSKAVNKIDSYISDPDFGNNIDLAISSLYQGSYKLAVIVIAEAEVDGACQVSNCEELLNHAHSELDKAISGWGQKNYVYVFNHLTNAWKFAMKVMGANLNKVGGEEEVSLAPTEYGLDQNYPNPFNPATTISYQLPENNQVSLRVYDILGNLVSTLVDQQMDAGYHSVNWDASQLASGIYIYRIISGSFISTKKMILNEVKSLALGFYLRSRAIFFYLIPLFSNSLLHYLWCIQIEQTIFGAINIFFMIRVNFLLTISFLLFSSSLFAQGDVIFNHLTIDDGLSQSSVTCILQDESGFMWFGTQDGLNRYDGYNFKIFKNYPGDSSSLTNNFIFSIIEDQSGTLYIETQGGDFHLYNPRSESFQTIDANQIDFEKAKVEYCWGSALRIQWNQMGRWSK